MARKQSAAFSVHIEDVNPHITCRLCRGYFRDPYSLQDCMHTFCKVCLKHAWRARTHKGECPYPGCTTLWTGATWRSTARRDVLKNNILTMVLRSIGYETETGMSLDEHYPDTPSSTDESGEYRAPTRKTAAAGVTRRLEAVVHSDGQEKQGEDDVVSKPSTVIQQPTRVSHKDAEQVKECFLEAVHAVMDTLFTLPTASYDGSELHALILEHRDPTECFFHMFKLHYTKKCGAHGISPHTECGFPMAKAAKTFVAPTHATAIPHIWRELSLETRKTVSSVLLEFQRKASKVAREKTKSEGKSIELRGGGAPSAKRPLPHDVNDSHSAKRPRTSTYDNTIQAVRSVVGTRACPRSTNADSGAGDGVMATGSQRAQSLHPEVIDVDSIDIAAEPDRSSTGLSTTRASEPGYRKLWQIYAASQHGKSNPAFVKSVELLSQNMKAMISTAWERGRVLGGPDSHRAQEAAVDVLHDIGAIEEIAALVESRERCSIPSVYPSHHGYAKPSHPEPLLENAEATMGTHERPIHDSGAAHSEDAEGLMYRIMTRALPIAYNGIATQDIALTHGGYLKPKKGVESSKLLMKAFLKTLNRHFTEWFPEMAAKYSLTFFVRNTCTESAAVASMDDFAELGPSDKFRELADTRGVRTSDMILLTIYYAFVPREPEVIVIDD